MYTPGYPNVTLQSGWGRSITTQVIYGGRARGGVEDLYYTRDPSNKGGITWRKHSS